MKNNIITIIFLFIPILAYSQEWQQGSQGIYYNNGKVGIGVSPQNGTFTVNDPGVSQMRIENDTPGGEPTIRLRARTADNSAWLHADIGIYTTSNSSETGFLGFKVPYNNTYGVGYKLVICSSGNVGIGTVTPDYKLSVNGTIGAKEVKITSTGWSDFVFAPDYNLPTLQDVEIFINQNGHLPDIPSAEEVKADGISLGEMDAKLLQKIEELTLYVIELKRENQLMKNRINLLENDK